MYKQIFGKCGSGKSIALLNEVIENPGKRIHIISTEENTSSIRFKLYHILGYRDSAKNKISISALAFGEFYEHVEKILRAGKDKIDLFLVDCVQGITLPKEEFSKTETVSEKLKALSEELNIDIVVTLQAYRTFDEKKEVDLGRGYLKGSPTFLTSKFYPPIPFLSRKSYFYKKIVSCLKLTGGILVTNIQTGKKKKIKFAS